MAPITLHAALAVVLCLAGAFGQTPEDSRLSPRSKLGPWEAVLCEGDTLTMECPAGYQLQIHDGFYGRRNGFSTCMGEDASPVSVRGCEAQGPIQSIVALCENLNTCAFQISGDIFGTPCYGFTHYLNVSFSCELLMETQTACDGDYVGLQCYAGQELYIESVMYGRDDYDTCRVDGMNNYDRTCRSDDAFDLVSKQCNGREWCYISAQENYFEDPCPSVSKYLIVNYTCAECTNDWGNDNDCERYAEWGDCENDQSEWMYGYCRKTCSGCHLSHECMNISPYDDCYYWSFIGECHQNPDFMNLYCREACNLCTEDYVPETPEPEPTVWTPPVVDENETELMMTTACPDEDAELTCPQGYHIQVYDVFYGRRDGGVCMNMSSSDSWPCFNQSPDPFNITSYLCNGRQSCNVYAGMPPFANPCPGMVLNRYLEVDWACVPCTNPWGTDSECDYWMSWYECENNPWWMTNNCFKSCSGCNAAEICGNAEPDYMCDYWALIGECENNSAWMRTNCAKSCRTCYFTE